jgi:hypothetical protein
MRPAARISARVTPLRVHVGRGCVLFWYFLIRVILIEWNVVQADTMVVEETPNPVPVSLDEDWATHIDPSVLAALPESEINRQTIIQKLITKEVQYLKDLDVIESVRPFNDLSGKWDIVADKFPPRVLITALHTASA